MDYFCFTVIIVIVLGLVIFSVDRSIVIQYHGMYIIKMTFISCTYYGDLGIFHLKIFLGLFVSIVRWIDKGGLMVRRWLWVVLVFFLGLTHSTGIRHMCVYLTL